MIFLKADKKDLPKIAAMHIEPSINLFLDNIKKEKDFRFYLEKVGSFMKLEPEGVIIAREDDSILGFIIITKDASSLMKKMFFKGYLFKWAINMIFGRFRLDIDMLKKSIRYLLSFSFIPLRAVKKLPKAKIMAIVVAKEKRNLGIGRGLIDKAIEYLKENKIKSLCVATKTTNLSALNFYKKCGFFISATYVESVGKSFILIKNLDY